MKNLSVHIVLSDTGWVLEKLAAQLKSGLPFVDYGLEPDASADIQYYMTYGTWFSKISGLEVAYFAHLEQDERTRKKFFDVARAVDYCVCHSKPYEDILREDGVSTVRTISPGVDLLSFTPKVKIGIVGRTYHTGRKGEALVAQVMDIPGIEWRFTGTGWPGPAENLSDADMPAFYRDMDYILVPSLYEGGPMSVVEALASGCEVIAPPIGWVPEFPHIEFQTGDVADLRRVLGEVVEKRLALRRTVLDRGWGAWVAGHGELFETLGRNLKPGKATPAQTSSRRTAVIKSPGIIVHGSETGVDKGGPSVRAPETVKRLKRLGYDARLLNALTFDQRDHDLYHVFNLSRTNTCRKAIDYARLAARPVVLSTIYLDPSERRTSEIEVTDIFQHTFSASMVNEEYARLRDAKARRSLRGVNMTHPDIELFNAEVKQIIGLVDHIICLSEHERSLLAKIGVDVSRSTIVQNPVESAQYMNATGELFSETYGVTDYVLCVGRLEPRKNQITLLHALARLDIPLVLVGHAPDPDYKRLLQSVAGPRARFIDRLPPKSPLLASAFAGSRVFCLPSWSEGAPLAALEAAAAGCNMVLSDRSSEREYFARRARYCDPGNPEQMAAQILEAYEKPFSADDRSELSHWVAATFNWERHAQETAAAYEIAATQHAGSAGNARSASRPRKIYIDLTSGANRVGPPSGIARVEERYALDLYDLLPGQVVFILWNSFRRAFIEVTHEQFVQNIHKTLHNVDAPVHLFNQRNLAPYASIAFEPDSILLVLGGAWIRNENYIHSLSATARVKTLKLVVFVHDVIQGKFKHWFPDNVGDEFTRNCRLIVNTADHIIVNSQCTLDDLREMAVSEGMVCPPIDKLRFGDEIEKGSDDSERPQFDQIFPFIKGKPFVLYVSAIDIRKNHFLLYNVWERMIQEYGDRTPHLIMVGSKGWNVDHFLALVKDNATIKNFFHIFHGINDATLSWLYRHCLFTVYPSHYEGWGLPVAESLNYGKICIAARAGSVPEVAPQVTDLIDPLDFVSWYRAITGYVFNPLLLESRTRYVVSNYKPLTWRSSAERLRDLLMNVRGGGRPIPVMRVGAPLAFDDQARNNAREIKIGGWYSPEKDGTWTLGALATLQCKLEGFVDSALILDLWGRGFTLGRDDFQIATVVCQGVPVGELKWSADSAADMVLISPELSKKMVADPDCVIELRIERPLAPANVRQNSTDRRQLGMMVKSIGLRPAPLAVLDAWAGTRAIAGVPSDIEKISLSHLSTGALGFKIPLLIDPSIGDDVMRFGKLAFVGLRLTIAQKAALENVSLHVEARIGTERLGEALLTRAEVTLCLFPVMASALRAGVILEISALAGSIQDLAIVDRGVFSSPIGQEVLSIPTNMLVDLTKTADRKGLKPNIAQLYWGLDKVFQAGPREALGPLFISGWSRLEAAGIWSDGVRACQLMRIHSIDEAPHVLSFEVRAYHPMRVTVRINGGDPRTWVFDTKSFKRQILVHHPDPRDQGMIFIEYEIPEARSPAEIEGATDTRKLGIMVASFAMLTLESFSALTKRSKFPALAFGAYVDCAIPGRQAVRAESKDAPTIGFDVAAPMFLAGWSKPESSGCWSDGNLAYLFVRAKSRLAAQSDVVLSCDARPYRPMGVHVRVNGELKQAFAFETPRQQGFKVALPRGRGDAGYLVEFQFDGATAPSDVSDSSDTRRLGLYLRSFMLKERPVGQDEARTPGAPAKDDAKLTGPPPPSLNAPVEAVGGGKPEVKPSVEDRAAIVAVEPQPICAVIDFSVDVDAPSVKFDSWYDAEVHGRWSRGASGYIDVALPARPEKPVNLAVNLRLAGTAVVGPRSVTVLLEDKPCASMLLSDDEFHQMSADVTNAIAGKSDVRVEIRCSSVYNPSSFGASSDNRDLGAYVRGLAFVTDGAVEEVESLFARL